MSNTFSLLLLPPSLPPSLPSSPLFLPPSLVLAEDAIKAALKDYKGKQEKLKSNA